jgi:hypothetical protein
VNHDAFARALSAFCRRTPFAPFRIELITGESFVVHHPEAVVVRGDLAFFRQPDRVQRLFDGNSVCQLTDISIQQSR